MASTSLIFVDGLGIGADSKTSNPYFHAFTPFLDEVTRGYGLKQPFPSMVSEYTAVVPADACLGVSGLPQSATGQTAIVTGMNAPRLMGRHISGFPTRGLRNLISSTNLMMTAVDSGFNTFLINAYSPEYFALVQAGRRKHAAFALMAMAAGVPFASLDDLLNKKSVYQDITNHILQKWGHTVPILNPYEVGVQYHDIMIRYDFSVFEYFQTDAVGHKKNMQESVRVYETLDQFFSGILQNFDMEQDTLVIVSDHGNIEDVTTGSHTRNPVPTILIGRRAAQCAQMVNDITDIPYLIRMILNTGKTAGGKK